MSTYFDALNHFDGGTRQVLGQKGTAGIWATYPQPFLSPLPGGLIDQIVGTAMLLLCIFALTDARNWPPAANLAPVLIGSVVLVIGISFGYNSGYAINPARDLGPRLFTYMAGWGIEVFRAGDGWWWVPIVGPLVGGVLGGLIYDLAIRRQHGPETTVQPGRLWPGIFGETHGPQAARLNGDLRSRSDRHLTLLRRVIRLIPAQLVFDLADRGLSADQHVFDARHLGEHLQCASP